MNTPEQNNTAPKKQESLAERSARLEAEAAQGTFGSAGAKEAIIDPLAPEPIEDYEGDAAQTNSCEQPSKTEHTATSDISTSCAEIETLQQELAQAKEHMIRAIAEAENTRKRARKEREDASKYAISSFAKSLLDVADNLRRALDSVPENVLESEPHIKSLLDGVAATERELLRAFEKHKISKLDPKGELFNPNFHEVMFEIPGSGQAAGTIIQVIETGYILDDRLLRPARVGVAKDDGSAPPETGSHTIDTQA